LTQVDGITVFSYTSSSYCEGLESSYSLLLTLLMMCSPVVRLR
jgi:hypothetical protein